MKDKNNNQKRKSESLDVPKAKIIKMAPATVQKPSNKRRGEDMERATKRMTTTNDNDNDKGATAVHFSAMAQTFSQIENVADRHEKVRILAEFLKQILHSPDLANVLSFAINELRGSQNRIQLLVFAAGFKMTQTRITDKIKKIDDYGLLAEAQSKTIKKLFAPRPLLVADAFSKLKAISEISRAHVKETKKMELAKPLFQQLNLPVEYKYFFRILGGNNGIGLDRSMAFEALATAYATHQSCPLPLALSNIVMYFRQRKSITHVCKSIMVDGIVDYND